MDDELSSGAMTSAANTKGVTRGPNLMVLLRYARVASVSTDIVIDGKLHLPKK